MTKTVPIKYRKRQELKRAFYKAAEREHGRAALLGAAFISSVAWDARLGPLVLFARCGCPQALNQFAEGAPNALVEGPLAAMSLAYLLRELHRSFNPVVVEMRDSTPQQKARGSSLRAELFQGRVAMLGHGGGRAPRGATAHVSLSRRRRRGRRRGRRSSISRP